MIFGWRKLYFSDAMIRGDEIVFGNRIVCSDEKVIGDVIVLPW